MMDIHTETVLPKTLKRVGIAADHGGFELKGFLAGKLCADGYTEDHYLPAAKACQSRAADKCLIGMQIVDWRRSLDEKWAAIHFGTVRVATKAEQHLFEVQVCLHGLGPKAVRVEFCADGLSPLRQAMTLLHPLADEAGGYIYGAPVPSNCPAADYTARVTPQCNGVAIPLEESRSLWHR